MKKRMQVLLTDDAWTALEAITKEANDGFDGGTISFSDVMNEMAVSSRIDIKALQLKHTSIKKSLRVLAATKDVDLEFAIKKLTELRLKLPKKTKQTGEEVMS